MSRKLAFLSLLGCVAFSSVAIAQPFDAAHPVLPKISDPIPYAGELVIVTVPFSAAAATSGTVGISSSTSGSFDVLPSSVGYNAGDTSVSFLALIDPFATGSIQITATMDSGSSSVSELLQAPGVVRSTEEASIVAAARF